MDNSEKEYAENTLKLVKGDNAWIGCTICREFGDHGWFSGRVTDVDDDSKKPGHRVFHVEYEDGDEEWIGAVRTLIGVLLFRFCLLYEFIRSCID